MFIALEQRAIAKSIKIGTEARAQTNKQNVDSKRQYHYDVPTNAQ